MLAWEILIVAVLAAFLMIIGWALRRRKAGAKLPGLRRSVHPPVDTFEHDVAAIQPSAPRVVEDYRTAHAIALANDNGMATEPDLRLAMFHYQSLLKTLLEDDGPGRLAESQR